MIDGDGARSIFIGNDRVRLHVLDNGHHADDQPPVLVVPGMGEHATEYAWLLDRLTDRRALAVDVRGRGRSDTPRTGYTWQDHIGDLRAVADARALDRPILVAFSRGSSYALGYALQFPDRVAGLVIGDYHARHAGLPEEFLDTQLAMMIRGVPVAERMSETAVRAVLAESREVPLWDRLSELRCPVLVIRGGRRGAVVTDDIARQWRQALPTVEIAIIAEAGHDLWSRDPDTYLEVLLPFLARAGAS
ncbi:alpha/beta fold hydrolase [Nocardia sp. NPDC057227]|uniref:alpha/beta fold hydrolase n=1 Tax=Nocardia sp. NPDC057227 TaxID=3346056 RepID=UPI003631667F